MLVHRLLTALWGLQETRGTKFGSLSLNFVSHDFAKLFVLRIRDVCGRWPKDSKGRQGGRVRWHKHQGGVSISSIAAKLYAHIPVLA